MSDAMRLWEHVFHGQPHLVALFTGFYQQDHKRLDMTSTRFYPPDHLNDALAWAEQQDSINREVYFCAHQLLGKQRVKEQAAPVWTIYADVDAVSVDDSPIRPTAVVESSPGKAHIYARLTRAVAPAVAERLSKRWALAFGADPSGFDLSQVLWVPRTHNRKYPGAPLVQLRYIDNDAAYDPDELERLLPPLPKQAKTSSHSEATFDGDQVEPPVRLRGPALGRFRGDEEAYKHPDKSWRLCEIARDLFEANASSAIVRRAVEERDGTLEFLGKFVGRPDADTRYDEIVAWAWDQLQHDDTAWIGDVLPVQGKVS
jgi:hypothetical protein